MIVAPLLRNESAVAYTETSVIVGFQDGEYVILVGELAAIDGRHLERPVGNLAAHEDALRRALDRIFTGF